MTGKGCKAKQKAARQARLSAALRENLKRRKAQVRSRTKATAQSGEAENAALSGTHSAAPQAPDFRRNQGRD